MSFETLALKREELYHAALEREPALEESQEFQARRVISAKLNLPYIGNKRQLQAHLSDHIGMRQPVLYGGAMGGGKDLTNLTNCSTPFGMKPIGSFKVGDTVHAGDGTVSRVIGVWPQGVSRVMRVTFSDGATIDAGPGHLWLGSEAMKRYKADRHWVDIDGLGSPIKGRIYTTEQIQAVCEKTRDKKDRLGGGKGGSFLIPVAQPVQFTRTSRWGGVKIDPYVLGVLLGDGSLSGGYVSFCSADPDIPLEVSRRLGYMPAESRCKHRQTPLWNYIFNNRDPIVSALDEYGLLGHRAWEKFIPTVYKYASIEERWWLLRGLMDTDGTVDRPGKISFTTVSKQLAEDVQFLVESLGGVVTRSERIGKSYVDGVAKECRLAYTLRIKFRDCSQAFFLPRKRSIAGAPQGLYRRVVSVEELDQEETTCITIDHPTGLFLATDRFIVTHNSAYLCAEAIRECEEVDGNKVLMARKELVTFRKSTLETLLALVPADWTHKPSSQMFIAPNGSQILYTGLGKEEDKRKLQSVEIGAFFGDEFTEVDESLFLMARTRLRWKPASDSKRIKVRLTCNPAPGWIKEAFITNPREGHEYIPALPVDNIENLPEGYMEDMRASLTGDWFSAYMMGDWNAFIPTETVLPPHLLDEAFKRVGVPQGDRVWGFDIARFGDDHTIGMQMQGYCFDSIADWVKLPIDVTADQIINLWYIANINGHAPRAINIDDVGVGGGVTDLLRRASNEGRLGTTVINGVIAQASMNSQPDTRVRYDVLHYANVKAQLWFDFRKLLESGAPVSLPTGIPELKGGLEAHRYEQREGKIHVEIKRMVKQRLGYSPDHADAVMLCMYQTRRDYVARRLPQAEETLSLSAQEREIVRQHRESQRRREAAFNAFATRFGVPYR